MRTCIENQVEYYTTHDFLKFYQDSNNIIIIKRRRLVSGTIHTLLEVEVLWKVHL